MNRVVYVAVLTFLIILGGCLGSQESDIQKLMERDDSLLKSYLSQNNVLANETALGYYYTKEVSNDLGNQIVNNDIVGIYYEIKTFEGAVIDSYFDESKPPRLFHHKEAGLVPRVINFASGLAKEGETFLLYVPSYLAYQDYSNEQLILPDANLLIKIKYAKILDEHEVKVFEENNIESYLEMNGITGFQKTDEGLFIKTINPGLEDSNPSKQGDMIKFTYSLTQLEDQTLIGESVNNVPFQHSLGGTTNLKFLNLALKDVFKNTVLEVIVPSHLGYGGGTQVFPYQIRRDFFEKGIISQVARPFEPLIFKVNVTEVN